MGRRSRIEFSRVLGPWGLGVLGASIAVTVSTFVGEGAILLSSGPDTPLVLSVGALLLLPVVLSAVSRASESADTGSTYSIVRVDRGSLRLFATGWLSIGGYLCLSALMVEAVSFRLEDLLERFMHRDLPHFAVVSPVAALAILSRIVAPVELLRARLLLAGAALTATVGIITAAALSSPEIADATLPVLPARHFLSGAALLGAGLWFVDVALDYRRLYRGTDRSLAAAVSISWALAVAIAVAVSLIAASRPDQFARIRGVTDGTWTRDGLRMAGFVVTLLFCGLTVTKAFSRLLRLTSAMARDGSLAAAFEGGEEDSSSIVFTLLFGGVAAGLATFVPPHLLVGLAAVTFLWSAAIAMASRLRRGRAEPAPAFALPLYPLFPVVALVVCAFLSLIVPARAPLFVAAWVLVGFGVRFLHRGEGAELGTAPDIEEADDEDVPVPAEDTVYRVLVGLGPASDTRAMIRLGYDMARARGGDVVVVRVVALLERLPRGQVQSIARRQWRALRGVVREVVGEDAADAYPVVRIATSEVGGIVDAAASHEADLVLLDMPKSAPRASGDHEAVVDGVLAATSRASALVYGEVPADVRRVVAAVGTGPDTPSVLSVAETLGKARDGDVIALSVVNPHQSEEDAAATVDALLKEVGVEARTMVIADENPADGIVRFAGAGDVVIMGTTRDRALTHAGTTGLWRDVTGNVPGAAMLVRRAERRRIGWVHELWEAAFTTLPTLTVGERAEVYAQMRRSARAGVDFYVLIVISAALAIFGLFQDSAAVVIGAMLVAPLMSPIVAISQGIVQGNVSLIRKGLASTLKGAIVAVAVSALFTLAMPDAPPTSQILARTAPTLLDLGVGLAAGAAAAYGISRKSVAAALPGVAIAVALVPPLCVIGYGLGADRLDVSLGATLLFVTNLAAIVFVATVLFLLMGFYPRHSEKQRAVRVAVLSTLGGLVLLSVPLAFSSWERSRVGQLELQVERSFQDHIAALGERYGLSLQLDDVSVEHERNEYVVRATIYAPRDFPAEGRDELLAAVEADTGTDARLEIRLVRAEFVVTDRD